MLCLEIAFYQGTPQTRLLKYHLISLQNHQDPVLIQIGCRDRLLHRAGVMYDAQMATALYFQFSKSLVCCTHVTIHLLEFLSYFSYVVVMTECSSGSCLDTFFQCLMTWRKKNSSLQHSFIFKHGFRKIFLIFSCCYILLNSLWSVLSSVS